MSSNPLPGHDGAVNEYQNAESRSTRYWQARRNVIFINGMGNSPQDHVESALGLSKLQMCTVIGVYNQSSGTFSDLVQCLADKWQWSGFTKNKQIDEIRTQYYKLTGNPANAKQGIVEALSRNGAAVPLFHLLRSKPENLDIFAHSQGNLILANVLTGIQILDGTGALSRFTVHSFGSPTVSWPAGFTHLDHGFTFDPVNWLSGFDSSFTISKVGLPTIPEGLGIFSHGFKSYLADDATFVVNHFRWGSFGMTASMDEEGLAACLANMGKNIPRVRAIFQRLYQAHGSDVDDVAELYLNKIKNNPQTLNAVKSDTRLRDLLIKAMEEGVAFPGERAAINLLQN